MVNARTSTLRWINLCPNFNLKRRRGVPLLVSSEMPLEEAMWKTVLAGTTALAIAGATLAYAQQGPDGSDFAPRWRPSAEDISAFGDARIAAFTLGSSSAPSRRRTGRRWKARCAISPSSAPPGSPRAPAPIARRIRSSGWNLRADVHDAARRRAQEARRRGRPALQEPGRSQKHRFVVLARLGGRQFGGGRGLQGQRGWMHRGFGGPERGPMRPEGGPRPQ